MIPSVPNYDESAPISTLGAIISLSSRKYESMRSNEPSQVSLMDLLSPINLLDLITPTVLLGPMSPLSSMVPMSSSGTVGSVSIRSPKSVLSSTILLSRRGHWIHWANSLVGFIGPNGSYK